MATCQLFTIRIVLIIAVSLIIALNVHTVFAEISNMFDFLRLFVLFFCNIYVDLLSIVFSEIIVSRN